MREFYITNVIIEKKQKNIIKEIKKNFKNMHCYRNLWEAEKKKKENTDEIATWISYLAWEINMSLEKMLKLGKSYHKKPFYVDTEHFDVEVVLGNKYITIKM